MAIDERAVCSETDYFLPGKEPLFDIGRVRKLALGPKLFCGFHGSFLALSGTVLQCIIPLSYSFWFSEEHLTLSCNKKRDGKVSSFINQFQGLHIIQFNFENKGSHLRYPRSSFLETLEVVLGEDEEPFLPPGEKFIFLLPESSFLEGGVFGVKIQLRLNGFVMASYLSVMI